MAETHETVSHQKDLDNLKKRDPEFYEFLKEEESGLLKFDGEDVALDDWSSDEEDVVEDADDISEIESSGEDEGIEEEADLSESQTKQTKKKKKQSKKLTEEMVVELKNSLMAQKPSSSAIRRVIAAFRCAVANIDGAKKKTDKEKKNKKTSAKKKHAFPDSKYSVTEASVFNAVVGVCIQSLPSALGNYLDFHPSEVKKAKKKKAQLPSNQPLWSGLRLSIQTYLKDATRFLELLMDASVKRVFLRHLMVMAHYFIAFPNLTKDILKVLISLWSSDDNESIRVLAFFFIMRINKLNQVRYLEKTLQRCYMSYVSNCKFTSPQLLPMINFMQQTYTELCSLDHAVTYNFAFLYIRQLAIHLRAAVTNRKAETVNTVYNWQFIHSIGLWSRVLSVLYPSHTLQPLIYPLIQVALGAIDLIPSRRHYPLRFRVLENLIQLGDTTDTYIPLVTQITVPLQSKEMKKKQVGRGKKQQRVYMDTMLKFSNEQVGSQSTYDATMDKVYDLLMLYFNSQAHTISFPEMAAPAVAIIQKFLKESQQVNYYKIMKNLKNMVVETANFIREKRANVTFEVTDIDAVASWERSNHEEGTPFYHHFNEYRAKREREVINEIAQRDAVVEERMPTVDHDKFRKKFKQQDKREFSELFEDEDVENVEESFKKIVEQGGFKRTKPKRRDFVEREALSEEPVVKKKPKAEVKVDAPRKKRPKVKVGAKGGKKDIVQDLHLSDIE